MTLLTIAFLLSLFGLLMVYNASVVEAFRNFGDQYYFLKNQLVWAIGGWFTLFIFSLLDYHLLKKIGLPALILNLFLLMIVLIPGVGNQIKGARRWLNLGIFSFQPTETLKTVLSIYLAYWLQSEQKALAFLILIGAIFGLVILQPDLGTAIVIIGSAFLLYYLSGGQVFKLFFLSLILASLGIVLILISPYRRARLKTFLDPTSDPLGNSYHIRQVLISLGSGGISGVGLGQSRQKYQYLPEATTDSIFAVVGEETGFLGGAALIGAFAILIQRGLTIAQQAKDRFGRLLAAGITSWLAIQVLVNLAAMVALLPLTGIPLPLISYGGSSLVVTLASIGILLNISRYNNK
ncbi:cell division protein FtsW [Candidatus Beckwithbacteria bacterium RBG_13_42_9]|uniref:Probable peptidoglycan glycosyltransferase FtsW n=1 Tax=Candidatus Beckwithbacteria bacterium RBG_13_42_9 TaxID=1797457 RepID=A0A1F5E7C3_9BACT|nr:MAG: cell division protein FtsW [Candidatus Beckwithbacteria bacterium RBG_13_42_9]